jgi:hypothetical protein
MKSYSLTYEAKKSPLHQIERKINGNMNNGETLITHTCLPQIVILKVRLVLEEREFSFMVMRNTTLDILILLLLLVIKKRIG